VLSLNSRGPTASVSSPALSPPYATDAGIESRSGRQADPITCYSMFHEHARIRIAKPDAPARLGHRLSPLAPRTGLKPQSPGRAVTKWSKCTAPLFGSAGGIA
jgi:hypothetical protein